MADIDEMNADRSNWASVALSAFKMETHCDDEEALRDLLTDLMHWCDAHDVSFQNELAIATRAYLEEI